MADENPISGSGGEDFVGSMGLDIGPYVAALQEALKQYSVFRSEFQKSISLRLDPTSLNSLSNAFGIQMRQAMTMLKGAQKESVQESAKAVKEINKEFKKISGFEAFKELTRGAKLAKSETVKELEGLKQAAKSAGAETGKTLAAGVQDGAAGAIRELKRVADAANSVSEQQAALAKGEEAKVARAQRVMETAMRKYSKKIGTDDAYDRMREVSRVDPETVPTRIKEVDGKKQQFVDLAAVRDKLRDIKAGYAEITKELIDQGAPLNRMTQAYENVGAAFDNVRRKFESLSSSAKKRVGEMLEADRMRIRSERGGKDSDVGAPGPITRFSQLEDITRSISRDEDQPLLIVRRRQIAAINAAIKKAEDEDKEADKQVRIARQVTEAAEQELDKIRARRKVLPADRQARLSPLPDSADLISAGPDGKPRKDMQAVGRLNDEIKREAANSATVSKALQDYDQALRSATRIADKMNARLEALGRSERVDPTRLIESTAKKTAAVNTALADAANRDIAALEKETKSIRKADEEREKVTKALSDYAISIRARTKQADKDRAFDAEMTRLKEIDKRYDKLGASIRPTTQAGPRLVRPDGTAVGAKPSGEESVQAIRSQARFLDQATTAAGRALAAADAANRRLDRVAKSTGLEYRKVRPEDFLDPVSGLIDKKALNAINVVTKGAVRELETYNAELKQRNQIIEANRRDEERINAAVKKAKAGSERRAAEIEAAADAVRRQLPSVPAAPLAGPGIVAASTAFGNGAQQFRDGGIETRPSEPQGRRAPVDTSPISTAATRQSLPIRPDVASYIEAQKRAADIWQSHRGIGLTLSQTAINMAKWLFFYKAVHEVTRLVQNAIRGFVGAGIEYNKELETQTLALRGILAEHATITGAQGQQLHGLAALNSLQVVAEQQWKRIQQAATAVVGTTADLMGLYTGILPFAAQLGADLETIMDLTQATAVAARLLDVSFQDARSAMVALLQGRALSRNRLVGALGFSRDEIQNLKGTDELLGRIQDRLSAFLLLTSESQQTFAALSESFKDFTGIVASGVSQPLVNLFKDFVLGLTETNGQFALFQRSVDGFKISPQLSSFIDFVNTAIGSALQPLREFGYELAKTSQSDLQLWVRAVQESLTWMIEFGATLVKIALGIGTFIAENRDLIKIFLAYVVPLTMVANMLYNFVVWTNNATQSTKLLGLAMSILTGKQVEVYNAATQTTTRVAASTVAINTLKSAIGAIGKATVIGAAITALFSIISSLVQLRQEAKSTQEAIESLGKMDINGLIQNTAEGLRSADPRRRVNSAEILLEGGTRGVRDLRQFFQGRVPGREATSVDAFTGAVRLRQEQENVGQRITDLQADILSKQRQARDLVSQQGQLEGRRVTAKTEAERQKLDKQISGITERIGALNKDIATLGTSFDNLSMRSDELDRNLTLPSEQLRKIENIVNQEPTVKKAVKDLNPGMILSAMDALKVVSPEFDVKVMRTNDGKVRNLQEVANAVMAQLQSLKSELPDLRNKVAAHERGRVPEIKIEKPTVQRPLPRYVSRAEDEIAQAGMFSGLEKAKIDRDEAVGDVSSVDAIRKRQELDRKMLQVRIDAWTKEREHHFKHLKNLTADEKEANKEQLDNRLRDINRNVLEAEVAMREQMYKDESSEFEILERAKTELGDVARDLAKIQSDIYGSVEESALASFDDTVKQITDKLNKIKDTDAATKARVDELVGDGGLFSRLRPQIAEKARTESVINVSAKQLDSLRQQEGLLLKSFEAGTVRTEDFLNRLRQLRDEQTAILSDQAAAFEARAEQLRRGLALPALDQNGKPRERTAEEIAAANAEIQAFIVRAQAARDAIADINSEAKKVQAALDAWANLTDQMREFIAAADGLDGTRTGLEWMIDALNIAAGLMDRITASASALSRIPQAFKQFKAMFSDADGGSKLGGSFGALGSLFKQGAQGIGSLFGLGGKSSITVPVLPQGIDVDGGAIVKDTTSQVTSAGATFMKAIPALGIGISTALSVATMLFKSATEKAKKNIKESWSDLTKSLAANDVALGKSIEIMNRERERLVQRYSKSKSGRAALKELLPGIDDAIEGMRERAKDIQKNFQEAFKQAVDLGGNTIKPGPFADFAKELMEMETFIRNYLDSIDTSTQAGLAQMAQALANVGKYVDAFFENAKLRFEGELMSFESEALSAQERMFSLINSQDGLYKQLRDLAEDRLDLEEQVQEEMERRSDAQNKLNDLAKKELDIRKRIAEIVRKAAEDEAAIRRRGVLEAQLSIAQQKAIEISKVRYEAQEEIDRLKAELAGLQDDIVDQTKDNAKKDRDFQRRRRALSERESEIMKEIRLTNIRLDGARKVAAIEGSIFGMAQDEFELAHMQNDLAARQAEIQVAKWRETKALVDSIVESAEGFFFEPPAGFPQIKVDLGTIIIDNSDHSNNTWTGGPGGGPGPGPGGDRPRRGPGGTNPKETNSEITDLGNTARTQGYDN